MPRPKTFAPKPWRVLADAYGGMRELADFLGASYSTLYRMTRGRYTGDTDLLGRVNAAAEVMGVRSPVEGVELPEQNYSHLEPREPQEVDTVDMDILEMIGEALQFGVEIPPELIDRMTQQISDDELIRLAEEDGVSVNVQRAVTALLEASL